MAGNQCKTLSTDHWPIAVTSVRKPVAAVRVEILRNRPFSLVAARIPPHPATTALVISTNAIEGAHIAGRSVKCIVRKHSTAETAASGETHFNNIVSRRFTRAVGDSPSK